jgi:hypothetical protein
VRACRIRTQLEAYRALHGNYPVSLLDLGIREVNGPIYYERDFDSPLVYHLWFAAGFRSTQEYGSDTGKWEFSP